MTTLASPRTYTVHVAAEPVWTDGDRYTQKCARCGATIATQATTELPWAAQAIVGILDGKPDFAYTIDRPGDLDDDERECAAAASKGSAA